MPVPHGVSGSPVAAVPLLEKTRALYMGGGAICAGLDQNEQRRITLVFHGGCWDSILGHLRPPRSKHVLTIYFLGVFEIWCLNDTRITFLKPPPKLCKAFLNFGGGMGLSENIALQN